MARILTGPEPEREPWQCPSCKVWAAPWLDEHKCTDPDDGQPAKPAAGPWQPGWGTSGTMTTAGAVMNLTPAQKPL